MIHNILKSNNDNLALDRFGVEFDRLRAGSHTALPVTIMKCRRLEAALEIVLILLEAGCKPNLDNVRLAALRMPQIQSILLHAASNAGSLKETWQGSLLKE